MAGLAVIEVVRWGPPAERPKPAADPRPAPASHWQQRTGAARPGNPVRLLTPHQCAAGAVARTRVTTLSTVASDVAGPLVRARGCVGQRGDSKRPSFRRTERCYAPCVCGFARACAAVLHADERTFESSCRFTASLRCLRPARRLRLLAFDYLRAYAKATSWRAGYRVQNNGEPTARGRATRMKRRLAGSVWRGGPVARAIRRSRVRC